MLYDIYHCSICPKNKKSDQKSANVITIKSLSFCSLISAVVENKFVASARSKSAQHLLVLKFMSVDVFS